VNPLETIREDVALGTQTHLLPSYSVTPHRSAGTPLVSPYGHHRYRHGQSLLNGLRSPPEMATSRTSHISIQSGHESDITSQIHVRLAVRCCQLKIRRCCSLCLFAIKSDYVYIQDDLKNLEMSGNYTDVGVMSGISLKFMEMSRNCQGKKSCSGKLPQNFHNFPLYCCCGWHWFL